MPPLAEMEVIDPSSAGLLVQSYTNLIARGDIPLTQELRLLVLLDQREKSSIFSAELHAAFTPRDKIPATRPTKREPRILRIRQTIVQEK